MQLDAAAKKRRWSLGRLCPPKCLLLGSGTSSSWHLADTGSEIAAPSPTDCDQPLILWLVRPGSNLQPDRYERQDIDQVR